MHPGRLSDELERPMLLTHTHRRCSGNSCVVRVQIHETGTAAWIAHLQLRGSYRSTATALLAPKYSTFHTIAKTRFGTTSRRWHGFVAVDPAQASSARREVDVLLVPRRATVYAKRLPSPEGVRFV